MALSRGVFDALKVSGSDPRDLPFHSLATLNASLQQSRWEEAVSAPASAVSLIGSFRGNDSEVKILSRDVVGDMGDLIPRM